MFSYVFIVFHCRRKMLSRRFSDCVPIPGTAVHQSTGFLNAFCFGYLVSPSCPCPGQDPDEWPLHRKAIPQSAMDMPRSGGLIKLVFRLTFALGNIQQNGMFGNIQYHPLVHPLGWMATQERAPIIWNLRFPCRSCMVGYSGRWISPGVKSDK